MAMQIRRQIEVSGIVQGVGFRPYIYRLATERQLAGTIRNTSAGVTIEIQGPETAGPGGNPKGRGACASFMEDYVAAARHINP